jgi:hypothetical protein
MNRLGDKLWDEEIDDAYIESSMDDFMEMMEVAKEDLDTLLDQLSPKPMQ